MPSPVHPKVPSSACTPAHSARSARRERLRADAGRRAGAPLVGALCASVLIAPAAGAQTFGKVLRGLERAARGDTSAARGARAGGALRLIEARVEGADAAGRRFALDSGVVRLPAAGPCGTARPCAPGADLRVVAVRLPGADVPAGTRVTVTTVVENRGRLAASASELALCFARGAGDGCAGARGEYALGRAPVPALAPGERVEVRQPVQLTVADQETTGWAIAAELDPDRSTAERNRENDSGRSAPTAGRLPALTVEQFDVPASAGVGAPLAVAVRLRNTSAVAASAPTELQLRGTYVCAPSTKWMAWGEGPNRVALPALGPGQTLALRLEVRDATRCAAASATIEAAPDPDARLRWAGGHERQASRTYHIR